MHESIVRTEEQIKKHLDKLAALADTKDVEVAQNNFVMHAVLTTFLNSDFKCYLTDIINIIKNYKKENK